jgi:hypothetical protein
MTSLSPELIGLFATSTGVGLLMIVAGVQKNALEWRRRRRSCPSCGRVIEARRCACTSS